MLLAFVMDIIVYFKSHRIDIDPEAHTSNESTPRENVEENLLRLRKMSHDDTEEVHMKIPIADENWAEDLWWFWRAFTLIRYEPQKVKFFILFPFVF